MKLYTYFEAQHNKRSLENLKIIGNVSLAVNYGDLEMLSHIYVTYVYSLFYYLATFLSTEYSTKSISIYTFKYLCYQQNFILTLTKMPQKH